MKAGNSLFIDVCDQAPHRLPTNNRWRAIEAHFPDGAGSVLLALLPIKGANTWIVYNNNQISCEIPDIPDKPIIDAPLTYIFRMGQWPCHYLSWVERPPIRWLWINATMSHFSYHILKTKNHWPSIDAHFNLLSRQSPLPSINACKNVWSYCLPSGLIMTWPCGQAEPSNLLARVTLIQLKFMYLPEWYIAPAALQFINQYSAVTASYSPLLIL